MTSPDDAGPADTPEGPQRHRPSTSDRDLNPYERALRASSPAGSGAAPAEPVEPLNASAGTVEPLNASAEQPFTSLSPAEYSPYGTPAPHESSTPRPPAPGRAFPDNHLGVWSLVLALLGIPTCCLGVLAGAAAVALGNRGCRAAAAGTANNRGVAVTGLVIGWLVIILWSVLGLVAFMGVATTAGF
ncbi:MAG: hypothetical protein ACTMIR_05570 [Cellulomonadaceae bacterium]